MCRKNVVSNSEMQMVYDIPVMFGKLNSHSQFINKSHIPIITHCLVTEILYQPAWELFTLECYHLCRKYISVSLNTCPLTNGEQTLLVGESFSKVLTWFVEWPFIKNGKNGKIKLHFPPKHKVWVSYFPSGWADFRVTHPDGWVASNS